MKSIVRATASISGSSVSRILTGLVTAKFLAVLLGPVGYGLMGVLQSLVSLIGIVAGLDADRPEGWRFRARAVFAYGLSIT